jgi:hypothetical protein
MAAGHQVELGSNGFRIDGVERALVAGQMEPFWHNALYWRRADACYTRARAAAYTDES